MPVVQESRPTRARSSSDSGLKAACSVSELAARCHLSRARWYELVNSGVMPPPCYCVHTRRPLYPRELQELAINLRMSNTSFDGRYVVFYNRRVPSCSPAAPRTASCPSRRGTPASPDDGRVSELIESLRVLGVESAASEITTAISECYPGGLPDDFEMGLTTVFRHLRRRDRAQ